MKDINSIEIIFENTESVVIDNSDIGIFSIDGIQENVGRIALNSISNFKSFNDFRIQLLRDMPYMSFGEEKKSLFERLKFNDITGVILYYGEKDCETLYVEDYEEENEQIGAPNLNQKYHIENGAMYIVISKEQKIFDVFDKSDIEDPAAIEFARSMYE